MKGFDFTSQDAKIKDSDGDVQTHSVTAAVASKNHAGQEVQTRTGVHVVREGDVLVQTERPGVYDVHTADGWKQNAYGTRKVATPLAPEQSVTSDPSQATAPGAANSAGGAK